MKQRRPGKFNKNSKSGRPGRDFRSNDDKPRSDKPRGDKPRSDKPRDDKPRHEKKRFEKPRHEKRFDKSGRDKPRFDKPKFDKPKFDKPQPRAEKSSGEHYARPNIYGFHAAREAWLNPQRRIQALYLTDTSTKEFEAVIEEGKAKGLKRPVPTKIFRPDLDKLLPPNAVHQGIGLVAQPLEEVSIQDFIIKSGTQPKTVLIMLDQVTDPHNVGAIIRSACAFGADGIIMQRMHAPELEGALLKAASGAGEHMPVAYETNLSRTLEELKENGFTAYGLDERGVKTVGMVTGDKIVFALGAEGPGLRRLVKENCDELVKLPTSGPIQSLNVSNAAAIALYALLTR